MARRLILGIVVSASCCGALASGASAAGPIQLLLSQGAAFSILGHSCGGIQERVYASGFAANGYPAGNVYMQTRCGGSGRGGGYKSTTYTGWASTVWTWFGETLSFARLPGAAEENTSFSAEDSHHDRIYNVGSSAYLETGTPPLRPPAAPTGVGVSVGLYESGSSEYLRMTVGWTAAAETGALVTSSTVTATPVGSKAPVLSATASGTWSTVYLGPVAPSTTYRVSVTNTDAEGTSEPSTPVELKSPNADGESAGPSTTSVYCEPATEVVAGTATTCTATVINTTGTPTGTVAFASSGAGSFPSGASCALSPHSEGVAGCSVSYTPSVTPATPVRSDTITASYGGDALRAPSNESTTVQPLSITVLAGGSFVIGSGESEVGQQVTLWSQYWSMWQRLAGGGTWPLGFSGFAAGIPQNPPRCGDIWTSGMASALAAVPAVMPELIAVVVSSSISSDGSWSSSMFQGDTVKVDVVRTDPGYTPGYGGKGTGTVVAQVCP